METAADEILFAFLVFANIGRCCMRFRNVKSSLSFNKNFSKKLFQRFLTNFTSLNDFHIRVLMQIVEQECKNSLGEDIPLTDEILIDSINRTIKSRRILRKSHIRVILPKNENSLLRGGNSSAGTMEKLYADLRGFDDEIHTYTLSYKRCLLAIAKRMRDKISAMKRDTVMNKTKVFERSYEAICPIKHKRASKLPTRTLLNYHQYHLIELLYKMEKYLTKKPGL